ncbi:MAG: hypothetical protein QOE01_3243 [Actinomycetota bacterium]|jgi:polyisoprenoid-binding protein YceI|nr:hypothetical protein [Actinomycetota bacterium]
MTELHTQTQTAGVRVVDGVELPTAGTFVLDPAHTTIGFLARHLMVTKVRGHFEEYTGSVTIAENPLESTAEATIATKSITTGNADRDTHLRSGDFLEIEKYPEIKFAISKVTGQDGATFHALGELTIKGVTREVPLEVELEGLAKDPWGNEKIALTATGEIDREDFGMTWNVALETGGVLVSKKIRLEIEAQANRQV